MAIVIRKSKDEYDAILGNKSASMPSNRRSASPEIKLKSSELETAKKIVKADEIVEHLKNEFDQQDYMNKKLVKHELVHEAASGVSITSERPISARPISAKKGKI